MPDGLHWASGDQSCGVVSDTTQKMDWQHSNSLCLTFICDVSCWAWQLTSAWSGEKQCQACFCWRVVYSAKLLLVVQRRTPPPLPSHPSRRTQTYSSPESAISQVECETSSLITEECREINLGPHPFSIPLSLWKCLPQILGQHFAHRWTNTLVSCMPGALQGPDGGQLHNSLICPWPLSIGMLKKGFCNSQWNVTKKRCEAKASHLPSFPSPRPPNIWRAPWERARLVKGGRGSQRWELWNKKMSR